MIIDSNALVVQTGLSIPLSQIIQITASAINPTYLIVNAFDRNEYSSNATGATGNLGGNGYRFGLSPVGGDARGVGLIFQYQSSINRYYNSVVGYLDQIVYTASWSVGDVTDLSLFGTENPELANAYAADGFKLMQVDSSAYYGTLTVATESMFSNSQQATPSSIVSIAESFVGQSCNVNGCWVLASTIAAEAGASLPLQSAATIAGQPNGEWIVAFNGPAGSSGGWQSMIRPGDMIAFVTASGTGHIATCVSGAGANALLLDNEIITGSSGQIVNGATDGSADDIVIQAPHPALQEWMEVRESSVVIYRLDTPVVSAVANTVSLADNASRALDELFSAADPAGKAVTAYQIFEVGSHGVLTVGGKALTSNSAANATTLSSLSQGRVMVGNGGASDTLEVRAYNGSYWGDWASLTICASDALKSVNGETSAEIAPTSSTSPAASPVNPGSAGGAPASVTPITAPSSAVLFETAPANENSVITPVAVSALSESVGVFRFFDTNDGTHFFTTSASERDGLLQSRSDLSYEGFGLKALASPAASDGAAEAVYRFFNSSNGTHFFTASASERDALIVGRSDLALEGIAFYEDSAPQPGDSAVYRFFDTLQGTHLFTVDPVERATILATRPDLTPEGIAFFAPG